MKRISIRQFIALALLCLFATALPAQFQKLYHYATPLDQSGGIFKDVQCLNNAGPNGESIVAVGFDNQAQANGVLAYHDATGLPLHYLQLNNPLGHPVDAVAICRTPSNKLVACFYDPVDNASDIVLTNTAGAVLWTARIPEFHAQDVVSGPGGGMIGNNIWITGNSTGAIPSVAVARLSGLTGAIVYYKDYQLTAPYGNTIGYEIDYSSVTQRLTVVGKTSVSECQDAILALRLMPNNGNLVWAKVYSAPNCTHEFKGKTLVRTPGTFNAYTIGFEHKDPSNPNMTFPGVIQIAGNGTLVSSYYTTGAGFFNGTDFSVDGLATDGTGFMLSGSFRNQNGSVSGYSLTAATPSNSVNFTEYETMGGYVPFETRLVDLDYFQAQGDYVIGGHFRAGPQDDNWPLWPTDVAFWLVDANVNGTSTCSNSGQTTDHVITPVTNDPGMQVEEKDKSGDCPLLVQEVTPSYFDQCTPNRLANPVQEELASTELSTFAYLEGKGQILAKIPTSAKSNVSVKLLDMQGRVLRSFSLSAGEHKIDAGEISAGIYFLQFQGAGITEGVQKIAIR